MTRRQALFTGACGVVAVAAAGRLVRQPAGGSALLRLTARSREELDGAARSIERRSGSSPASSVR